VPVDPAGALTREQVEAACGIPDPVLGSVAIRRFVQDQSGKSKAGANKLITKFIVDSIVPVDKAFGCIEYCSESDIQAALALQPERAAQAHRDAGKLGGRPAAKAPR
jgi:hypothetical protein